MTTVPLRLGYKERARKRKLARDAKTSVGIKKKITYDDLDDDQLNAFKVIKDWWENSIKNNGIVKPLRVGGHAGCGKSTLISIVMPELKVDGVPVRIKYCAYMGRSADVLVKKGLNASTIHSLIYKCITDPGNPDEPIFVLKDPEEIDTDLIVIDEGSTVDEYMERDLKSLRIPLLYIGDHGQNKPVMGDGFIMEDPDVKLETPHRAALEDGITLMGMMVREGRIVEKGKYGVNGNARKVGSSNINDKELISSPDIVLCYTNKMRNKLNSEIREMKGYTETYPEVGEKLICIKNNRYTGSDGEVRLFNGSIFTVDSIRYEGGYLYADLTDEIGKKFKDIAMFTNSFEGEDPPKVYGRTMVNQFDFAYCITGHKAIGSEWENVVVVEEKMSRCTLEERRRWLYTSIMRASKNITWISRFG